MNILKILSVHIFDREMKPSYLAGLFEYLFMFWLYRHLPAKQALNSFIESNIGTDGIFNNKSKRYLLDLHHSICYSILHTFKI